MGVIPQLFSRNEVRGSPFQLVWNIECLISVRLLECVLFLAGAVLLAHGLVEGRTGAALFTCAYGFVLGAYHYVTKV